MKLFVLVAIVVVVLAGFTSHIHRYTQKIKFNVVQRPHIDLELYGRDNEANTLSKLLLANEKLVVEVVGIAGVGKTALVLNTTDKLIKEGGFCQIYIDVSKYDSILLLLNDLVYNYDCHNDTSYTSLILNSMITYLAPTTDQRLQFWNHDLNLETLLVLDNADDLINDIEEIIVNALMTTAPAVKIVLVSKFSGRKILKRPVVSLHGLKAKACARWVSDKYPTVRNEQSVQLCNELSGVPSEVKSILEYVMHPLTSGSLDEVIAELKNKEYGKAFAYIESILGMNYEDTKEQNRAMYLLYDRLKHEHRECIWLLVELRKDGEFTKEMAKQHLPPKIDVNDCLDSLLAHSLLELMIISPTKIFKFRPYIKKFIESIGEPQADLPGTRFNARLYYGNYVFNNAKHYHIILENTSNLELAVKLGSNRQLVNSLLPLLGDKYDVLQPLFKTALAVIERHYCTPVGYSVKKNSTANILTAFDYLTKAVHCPSIHPPVLLSPPKQKLVPKPNLCLQKLKECPAILFMNKRDHKTAEALGYHNSLLIYAHPSPPWRLSLTDISLMVTVANYECVHYCKKVSLCPCGDRTLLEYGLRLFLLRNYPLSGKYFQYALQQHINGDSPCQTILKVISIIGLFSSNSDRSRGINSAETNVLMNINFDTFNYSCFLGVMNDLIAPFLKYVGHEGSHRLYKNINQTLKEEEQRCYLENKTDVERLDCDPTIRYTIGHGLLALKMTELQISSHWPQEVSEYASRDEWVCSIIRDKTTKCKEALPLFSDVRSIETNKNYRFLRDMKYFMSEQEFSKLKERAYTIPMFFQLMSV